MPPTISADQFAALFPFHVAFDDAFVITAVGASAARIFKVIPGQDFTAAFTIERPTGPVTPAFIRDHPGTLFVVRAASGLALRGQMLPLPEQGQTVFLCTPLLHDAATMTRFELGYADFAVHDATIELAQVARSQEIALDDLRHLASRLKRQREELRDANIRLEIQSAEARKLALIASRTDNGVVITDAAGLTEWVNDAFVRMTGRTIEELRGKKPGSILQHPDADPAVVASMGQHLRRGEGFVAELLNRHKDGTPYWVHVEVQPIHDDQGNVVNFMAIERDITEIRRRAAELTAAVARAEQANQEKTEFLAHMSHEIRTPLHTIIGMTALLREGALGVAEEQLAATVATSSEALLHIVNDLLDVAKIEAGQVTLELSEFDPIETCEEAVALLRSRINPHVLVTLAHDPGPLPRVVGDAHRLRQIVVNLIGNALKFTPAGRVGVHVSWTTTVDRCALVVTVDDTGIGIPADQRDRVFEKFYRGDDVVVRKVGGVGLGLSISQLLAKAMGGAIRLENKDGPGARFVIALDLVVVAGQVAVKEPPRRVRILAAPDEARQLGRVFEGIGASVVVAASDADPAIGDDEVVVRYPDAGGGPAGALVVGNPLTPSGARRLLQGDQMAIKAARPLQGPGSSQHVLVIDDNPDGQRYVRLVLTRAGFEVTTGASVQEAIDLSAQHRFDLILMDISLPDGSGIDATRSIRDREKASGRFATPIVALSAHGMRHHHDDAMAAGVDDYVTKPVKPDALIAVVSRHVRPASAGVGPLEGDIDVEVDPEIADLIDGFLARARQRAAAVVAQLDAGDTTTPRRFAHDLKGTGAMFGFHRMSVVGQDLETALLAGDLAQARRIHAELQVRLDQLRWRVRPPDRL